MALGHAAETTRIHAARVNLTRPRLGAAEVTHLAEVDHAATCSAWVNLLGKDLHKQKPSPIIKLPSPENCQALNAPILNPEVGFALKRSVSEKKTIKS